MQDRYVGDIGDYGKYGLLRLLCANPPTGSGLRGGVVWYRAQDESHNSDGRHVAYLNDARFTIYDPDVYHTLKRIVSEQRRAISSIETSGILPEGTVFFSPALDYRGILPRNRISHRRAWTDAGIAATLSCELIFLDPDNGLEIVSCPVRNLKAPKYVLWSELGLWAEQEKTLLIYHHLNRRMTAEPQIYHLLSRIRATVRYSQNVKALLFRKGSLRAFFLISSEKHLPQVDEAVARLTAGPWGELFRVYRPSKA